MSELPSKTHNNPPSELELLVETLTEKTKDLAVRVKEFEGACERGEKREINSHDVATAVEDQIKQFDEVWKEWEAKRVAALAPIDRQRQVTHNHYKNLLDQLVDFKKRLTDRLNVWQNKVKREEEERRQAEAERARQAAEKARREREEAERKERERQEAARRAAEEAARKEREAADAAAEAERKRTAKAREKAEAEARKKAEEAERARRKAEAEAEQQAEAERKARAERRREVNAETIARHTEKQAANSKEINKVATVRGSYGGVASLRKTYDFRIVDEDIIPRRWLMPAESRIRDAINDGVKSIPGIEIFEVNNTVTK